MTDLRDAIARRLGHVVKHRRAAEDILATPEMQAIRRWLRDEVGQWCCPACLADHLDQLGVPASVSEWVQNA